jgi:hypothetical protein
MKEIENRKRKRRKEKKRKEKNRKGPGDPFGPTTEAAHGPISPLPNRYPPFSLFSLTAGPTGQATSPSPSSSRQSRGDLVRRSNSSWQNLH